jgi:lipoprotein-anchoring transpeptidase ErfK/SrfK
MMRKKLLMILAFLFFFVPQPADAQIITDKKLITIDIGKQMLYAWDGGKIVYQTPVSTGMRLTPTMRGNFAIRTKVPMQDMRGPSPYKQYYPAGKYFIKNVPHVMYFYQAYAIHGAYWHNNFGRMVSHGCVNVPLYAAEWLFNWTDVGTQVLVF